MHTAKTTWRIVALLAGFFGFLGGCAPKPIAVYTHLDPAVLDRWAPLLAKAVPKAKVRFVTEERGADLRMEGTREQFQEAKREGKLRCESSTIPPSVDAAWVDPEGCFAAYRISLYVIGYDTRAVPPKDLPERWSDLDKERWQGKVGASVGDLEHSREPLATVFLEDILRANARNVPVRALYPLDGLRAEGWPVAILNTTHHPKLAAQVMQWFFSAQAQNEVVRASYYSPVQGMAYPEGARAWDEVRHQLSAR